MYSDGKNIYMMDGNNQDIVKCWCQCYEQFKNQPQELVSDLRISGTGQSVDDKCQAVFGYMVDNTYYRLDNDGEQLIKSPGRLLADGCGDCKSYTMFIASCLHCLGIPCKVRFVNFDGGNQFTHVYPVAIDEQGREIIMDACELSDEGIPYYDYARPYAKKKDIYYGK